MHCAYCGGKDPLHDKRGFELKHTELNDQYGGTATFTLPFCSFSCWDAFGVRAWRKHHNAPYDPDQLNLGVAPHDEVWDISRFMK